MNRNKLYAMGARVNLSWAMLMDRKSQYSPVQTLDQLLLIG